MIDRFPPPNMDFASLYPFTVPSPPHHRPGGDVYPSVSFLADLGVDINRPDDVALDEYWLDVWRRLVAAHSNRLADEGEPRRRFGEKDLDPRGSGFWSVSVAAGSYWDLNKYGLQEYFVNETCGRWPGGAVAEIAKNAFGGYIRTWDAYETTPASCCVDALLEDGSLRRMLDKAISDADAARAGKLKPGVFKLAAAFAKKMLGRS